MDIFSLTENDSAEAIMFRKAVQKAQERKNERQLSGINLVQGNMDSSIHTEKVIVTVEDQIQLAKDSVPLIDEFDDNFGEYLQFDTVVEDHIHAKGDKKPPFRDTIASTESMACAPSRRPCENEDECGHEHEDSSPSKCERLFPLRTDHGNPHNTAEDGEFDSNAATMLSPSQVRRYFGDPARGRFHSRCSWIRKQQEISVVKSPLLPSLPKNLGASQSPKASSTSALHARMSTPHGRQALFADKKNCPPASNDKKASHDKKSELSKPLQFLPPLPGNGLGYSRTIMFDDR